MTEVEKIERAARVVSLIAKAQAAKREEELKHLLPFFEALGEQLADILRSFTPGLVKCSIANISTEAVDPTVLQPHGLGFEVERKELNAYFREDRSFDLLLCEVCFGGTGTDMAAEQEPNRPASKIELLLRKLVLDTLYAAIPSALGEVMDLQMQPRQEQPFTAKGHGQNPIACVKTSYLVNVHTQTAEIEILFPISQMEIIFGASSVAALPASKNMKEVLANCPFEIVAALPEQGIGLLEILNLSVGAVLKLNSTPNDPSILYVEGISIGKGKLNLSNHQLGISVL